MKCSHCGYDKIQPDFIFCPNCKQPLNQQSATNPDAPHENHAPEVKWWGTRILSGWTYAKAAADPHGFAKWAVRNPNDSDYFLARWEKAGNDISMLRDAVATARRARIENPTADDVDVSGNIIDTNQQNVRQEDNTTFVEAVNADYTTDAAAIVRNKAIWKLQAGELSRHIAPDEWFYVTEHLEGLVIEEGTSAIIYIDGEEVAQMGSGMYVFDNKHEAAAALEAARRKEEVPNFFDRIIDGVYRLFTGHRREESAHQREERRRRVRQIMGRLKKNTIVDVYLKSDRIFPAIFGQQHWVDSPDGYQPYLIQARDVDVQLGVSMLMQIGNFKEFITNYMPGHKTIGIADVVKSIDDKLFPLLRYRLRDVEITERGLDERTFNDLKEHLLHNFPNVLHGLLVIDVLDITTSNKELARFRKVEEELYCDERNLDYLRRTNEFRNRLASEENDQQIRAARSEQDLRYRLDEINKDHLIHEDEMEQFVSLLMNQKVIREATNTADLDQAMLGIERNKMVSHEEFDIFVDDLLNRRFDRHQVSEQLRARSLMATALQKLELNKTFTITELHSEDEVSDVKWDMFRKEKGREAEYWDLEAAIYGKKYVLDRQQQLDKYDMQRTDNAFDLEKAKNDNLIAAERLQGLRFNAEFFDERVRKSHEMDIQFQKDQHQIDFEKDRDKLQLDKERSGMAISNLEAMSNIGLNEKKTIAEIELEKKKAEYAHDEALKDKDVNLRKAELEADQHMNAAQLMAKRLASMDIAAQQEFAKSFSHLKEIELTKENAQMQKELYEKMIKMAQDHNIDTKEIQTENSRQQMDVIKQIIDAFTKINTEQTGGQNGMLNAMVGVMKDVANGKIRDSQNLKEEYREQMHHEQQRTDENQKQSLDYTSRVKMSENAPFGGAGRASVRVDVGASVCPRCGKPIQEGMNGCPYCGMDLK